MASKTISPEIRQRAEEAVSRFNAKLARKVDAQYVPRFKGAHLYLGRCDFGRLSQVCRLTYTGDFNEWAFAIYKHSSDRYDPEEWLFPGSGAVDGTIEGAMKAGLEAYPP